MKRFTLVLAGILVLSIFGVSVALASVSIPPNEPQNNPPGKVISDEERIANAVARDAREVLEQQLERCNSLLASERSGSAYLRCREEAFNAFQDIMSSLVNARTPPLKLPNGGSPGQDK
ncbi:MAG: hypothetical protein HYT16_04090 [DPANN group archaeon]|nr:hypothetical protein [DPANN group archaeon]